MQPDLQSSFIQHQTQLICSSYQHWTGCPLLNVVSADALMHAPFAVVSHGTEADPIFNYANLTAQQAFKMDWLTFTQLPSRYSAEIPLREARERILAQVAEYGFIDNYAGIRIASDGTRFEIKQAIVWNLIDAQGYYRGQAAKFDWP